MKLLRLMIATLTLATAGYASAQAPKPTVNVTGNWIGSFVCNDASLGSGIVVMKLNQTGSKVVGDVSVTGRSGLTNAAANASIQGDQLVLPGTNASGSFTVSGDTMSGDFLYEPCQRGKLTMNREPYKGAIATSRLRTVNLTVEALDLTNRVITLRGPQGGTLTMQVDERVKNLPQISVGDLVTVAYYESWVLDLNKPGEQPSGVVVGTAAYGEPPAGFVARRSTIQATVTAIDAAKPSVTFQGPKGTAEISVAKDPRVLSRLKVGETYNVSYTENLAVAVDKQTKP